MRYKYTIYPEAKKKLEEAGLTDRIKEAYDKHEICVNGYISDREVVEIINDMKERGCFKDVPKGELGKIGAAWKNRESANWLIKRFDGDYSEKVESDDFLIFTGWKASQILKEDELFNYKKFGFSNPIEFVETFGAAIEEGIKGNFREGYVWQSIHPNGIIYHNQITGDHNADLRVFQTDITPYETVDPLGNKVLFRPEIQPDRKGIYAYHSNEGEMLVAVLKWIEQLKLEPQSLEKKASEVLDWARGLGQSGGTCAEHFGGYGGDAALFLSGWDIPLPLLDKNGIPQGRSNYSLSSDSGHHYGAYVGDDGKLLFRYDVEGNRSANATFIQSDADHLVKGLLYQSAKGLGRTSARQLTDILKYRFSDQFQKDLDKTRKDLERMRLK